MKMSKPTRRQVLAGGIALSATAILGSRAIADDGPIRWIVGYPPGGATDTIARLLSAPVSTKIGQTIIVDNRPGAGSSIAAAALAKSRPDGLTVMAVDNGTLIINPVAYSNLQYDPDKDFRPVGLYAEVNILLAVGKDQPYKTVAEFLEQAKAASTPIAYASPGIGSPLHLAMERLARDAAVKLEHVPYKGMAPALTDVLAGVVPSIVIDYTTAKEVIRSGELRPLAVFSKSRLAPLPEVPAFGEQALPGFSAGAWQGMVVPHDTPDDVVSGLTEALAFALQDNAVKKRYDELGLGIPASSDPQAFSKRWQDDKAILQPLIRELGIKLGQ
ncbi:MAG: tripartite tricarboxylate transporter substrate binding protein [Mesorhizobium sp.]|uniref:Bug family tripartite tricarboxylate transporter substrate binding protein n=1 Tax=Mesorhizobium sp. TaxID=1871066 RepID=UPI0011F7DF8A|nr:tripartite tricarboxylate transporter substrate binding protein [Mesorhizobium sp.]TIQ18314.1 MAG: tripartite tricarboxylate transporter substrate binding protein [Mesorhizobium sp.]